MKKLIVLGIIATMVMGLAVAASAQDIDAVWAIQLQASNAKGQAQSPLTIGTRAGAIDGFTIAAGEDSRGPAYTGVPGTIHSLLLPVEDRVNKDQRAPLGPNETKVWDLTMFCVGGAAQMMTLKAWSVGAATLQDGGNLRVWIEVDGEEVWQIPYDSGGAPTAPQYTGDFYYGGENIDVKVYASTVAGAEIPEPGSMLAMFSGLVGLVGFGIRRRK